MWIKAVEEWISNTLYFAICKISMHDASYGHLNTLCKSLYGGRIGRYAKTNFSTKEAQAIARSRIF